MIDSFLAFAKEANIPEPVTNNKLLYYYMRRKLFSRALNIVKGVMEQPFDSSLKPSFDDMVYVLAKYLIIHLSESRESGTEEVLAMVLWPIVQKEQYNGGMRAQWFTKGVTRLTEDFQLLQDLASGAPASDNCYLGFNWNDELSKFWQSIEETTNGSPPLFAFALKKYFGGTTIKYTPLEQTASEAEKFNIMKQCLTKLRTLPPQINNAENPRSRRYKRPPFNNSIANLDVNTEPADFAIPIPPPARKSAHSARGNNSQVSEVSYKTNFAAQEEAKMPPLSSEPENASFALAAVCGPSLGPIQVLAVHSIPETGQIVAATAGGEDRSDKRICIWDIRDDTLLTQLDNSTVKAVTSLMFHPSFPNLLLSSDMAYDVKLWNWKENTPVRHWKKHHSRIIFQLGFVPGDDTRYIKRNHSAISCSGDQSLRIWNIHSDRGHRSSLHANEPITSFAFCGSETDPHQQKVVVSLSSSIRIYKLRTLQLIHSINLKDIKPT
jgi:hypothetical protein